MGLAKRLSLAMKLRGLSQAKLGEAVGISQTSVWKLLSGVTTSNRKLVEIADYLNINVEWLVKGIGEMEKDFSTLASRIKLRRMQLGLTQEEVAEKVGIKQQSYQAIESGEVQKPRYLYEISNVLQCDMAWLLNGKDDINVIPINLKNNHQVPIISYVQAGLWAESCDMSDSTGYDYLQTDLEVSDNSFALRIKGKSMEPDFKEGDMIIVDPSVHPLPGEFVVAANGSEEATFKKYRELGIDEYERMQFELIPLNPDFPKLSSLTQQIRILGTVVEHRTYRRKR